MYREGNKESFYLLVHFLKFLSWPGLGQNQNGNKKLNPGHPYGWQGPNHLSHHCYFPESALAGTWIRNWSWDSNADTPA